MENIRDLKLVMSASETLFLVRDFAFFWGDVVPEDNEMWLLYLSLRDFVGLITSPTMEKIESQSIELLASELNERSRSTIGENNSIKLHLFLHYPSIFKEVGPLVHLNCIRQEAKRREGKIVAKSITSRKNIVLSILLKNQLAFSERVLSQRAFLREVDGNFTEIDAYLEKSLTLIYDFQGAIKAAPKVTYNGRKLFENMVLILSVVEEDIKFGVIKCFYIM